MDQSKNGERAQAALWDLLQADGWYPEETEVPGQYHAVFAGQNGQLSIYARIVTEAEMLLCYSVPHLIDRAPPESIPAVAEFFTRANYGLRIGNFEVNLDAGHMRFKTSVDFAGLELTPPLIKNALIHCAYTFDRYLPGLSAVFMQGQDARAAIALVEGGA